MIISDMNRFIDWEVESQIGYSKHDIQWACCMWNTEYLQYIVVRFIGEDLSVRKMLSTTQSHYT